jgi:hypothetical protein
MTTNSFNTPKLRNIATPETDVPAPFQTLFRLVGTIPGKRPNIDMQKRTDGQMSAL